MSKELTYLFECGEKQIGIICKFNELTFLIKEFRECEYRISTIMPEKEVEEKTCANCGHLEDTVGRCVLCNLPKRENWIPRKGDNQK